MKNVKIVILTMVTVLLSVTSLYAFSGPNAIDNKLYTKDTLALEPLASDNAYQEAKLWFLPDYQESISSDGVLKPSTPNNCASFNNDGSGRTYISNPDLNFYTCSGPRSMANKVKCYYDCKCKIAENTCSDYPDTSPKSGNGWSNTSCRKFSVASCSYGATMYKNTCTALYTLTKCPANGVCSAPDCAGKIGLTGCDKEYKKSGNTCVCATTCSNKISTKPANSKYTYETCTACSVSSQIQSGWSCVSGYQKNSAGTGCEEICTPNAAKTTAQCSYGLVDCDDGCGGTTKCCKGCTPNAAKTAAQCTYGLVDCDNGCGGTTKCCAGCTPNAAKTTAQCTYGLVDCDDGCGGKTKCCAGCTPTADETDCSYGSKDVDNGCGGTRKKCKTICEDYGGTHYSNYSSGTYKSDFDLGTTKILEIYKCYTGTTAYNPDSGGRCGHSNICATVKTCPSGQVPNAEKTACTTVSDCSAYQGWPYTTLSSDPVSTCKKVYSNATWVSSDGYVECGGRQYYKCSCASGYSYHTTYKTCYPVSNCPGGCASGYTCCSTGCQNNTCSNNGDSNVVTFTDIPYDPVAYCTSRGYDYETTFSIGCDTQTRCYKCRKKSSSSCSGTVLSCGCGYSSTRRYCCRSNTVTYNGDCGNDCVNGTGAYSMYCSQIQ